MSEQTIPCPICGQPYVFYPFMVGDQSACWECRAKARGYDKYKVITSTNTEEVK